MESYLFGNGFEISYNPKLREFNEGFVNWFLESTAKNKTEFIRILKNDEYALSEVDLNWKFIQSFRSKLIEFKDKNINDIESLL